jgi:hypothetical protein
MSRIQVQPYCPFGRDTSWMTQTIIEGYIYAWIKGERFAETYISKYAGGDLIKISTFKEVLVDDMDFDDLKDQIWEEMNLPAVGTIEYHIWQIERLLQSPYLIQTELAKLYKILGEYRGWIAKPGEAKVSTTVVTINDTRADLTTMNEAQAEILYHNVMTGRN